jgi:hypothetical protein
VPPRKEEEYGEIKGVFKNGCRVPTKIKKEKPVKCQKKGTPVIEKVENGEIIAS